MEVGGGGGGVCGGWGVWCGREEANTNRGVLVKEQRDEKFNSNNVVTGNWEKEVRSEKRSPQLG